MTPQTAGQGSPYPPGTTAETFRRIPARHREDAIQEAWLAYLEGRKPRNGALAYLRRELRHESRQTPYSQLRGNRDIEAIRSITGDSITGDDT